VAYPEAAWERGMKGPRTPSPKRTPVAEVNRAYLQTFIRTSARRGDRDERRDWQVSSMRRGRPHHEGRLAPIGRRAIGPSRPADGDAVRALVAGLPVGGGKRKW
jgi:hypothetical protein